MNVNIGKRTFARACEYAGACAGTGFAAGFLALALTLAATAELACAQGYPSKPVRIVVPFSAGSTLDIIARILAPKLQEALGQTVFVDNRPGAGGVIGMEFVAKSAPDGYTYVIAGVGQFAMTPALYPKPPYDPVKEFSAVSMLVAGPLIIAIHPSIPVKSLSDLVALAKKRPGQLNFGSPGVGTSSHLAGELFKIRAGIDIVHIPYKGNAEAMTDLVGGQLQMVTEFSSPNGFPSATTVSPIMISLDVPILT